jgi:hypothetical protein
MQWAIDLRDFDKILTELFVDADHGGDLQTARSTSGWATLAVGSHGTNCTMDWGAFRQKATAKSTGEAEIVGFDDGLCRSGLIVAGLWEEALGRPVLLRVRCDSDACMLAIKNGISAKMRYIRKHQRISIGFLHDAMDEAVHDDRETVRVDSADNIADMFTKPLHAQSFCKHRLSLGIRP